MRHISLSTCGLVDEIDKLAEHGLQLTLSVSLHAPDDETRSQTHARQPGRGAWSSLMAACRRYFQKTGRRISYEYAMIDGVNDTTRQADLLAERLEGSRGHVNLIPLNDVEESRLKPSTPGGRSSSGGWRSRASPSRSAARLGSDIDASCGQLRRKAMREQAQGPAMTSGERR